MCVESASKPCSSKRKQRMMLSKQQYYLTFKSRKLPQNVQDRMNCFRSQLGRSLRLEKTLHATTYIFSIACAVANVCPTRTCRCVGRSSCGCACDVCTAVGNTHHDVFPKRPEILPRQHHTLSLTTKRMNNAQQLGSTNARRAEE